MEVLLVSLEPRQLMLGKILGLGLVTLAGLIITAYLCVALAARSFRADTLLSAAPLSWQRLRREWRPAS